VVAVLASLPPLLWEGVAPFLCSVAGLASIGAAYFFYYFNPGLSLARGLDYVGQYYVSFDPRASWWPDRWLANRAIKAWPDHGTDDSNLDKNRRAHAAHELQRLLQLSLWAGVIIYGLAMAIAICLR
jgi:hypothetical protein